MAKVVRDGKLVDVATYLPAPKKKKPLIEGIDIQKNTYEYNGKKASNYNPRIKSDNKLINKANEAMSSYAQNKLAEKVGAKPKKNIVEKAADLMKKKKRKDNRKSSMAALAPNE